MWEMGLFYDIRKSVRTESFFLCDGSLMMIYQTCSLDCREQCYTVEGWFTRPWQKEIGFATNYYIMW